MMIMMMSSVEKRGSRFGEGEERGRSPDSLTLVLKRLGKLNQVKGDALYLSPPGVRKDLSPILFPLISVLFSFPTLFSLIL